MMLVACAAEKPAPTAPDFGDEDAKLDSARAPASFVDIAFGDTQTASFTSRSQFRAFRFSGQKGQKVSLFVDGKNGLDTVVYLYKATTDHPWGKALATNDDTTDAAWTKNEFSSSIAGFVLPDTRDYALVATTYFGDHGSAGVTVKTDDGCGGCPDGQFCQLEVGACGAGRGTCTDKPRFCFEIYKPVCGCDGKTYGNDCARQGAGIQLDHNGTCN
jgi:hypothetical protein